MSEEKKEVTAETETGELEIDVEKTYSISETADKLRRIADAMDEGRSFRIQVAGNRLRIPTDGSVQIEIQSDGDRETGEIEIEIKWDRSQNE